MKNSIRLELLQHIKECFDDGRFTPDNIDEWHHIAFNEDYYIIGYYNAEQWLKKHDVSAFEAISACQEWEENVLGEKQKTYDDPETTVNMYVYVLGEELIGDLLNDVREEIEDNDSIGEEVREWFLEQL